MRQKVIISILLSILLECIAANQIYFPDYDSQNNATALLEQSRNTNEYEPTVDAIISRGVLKFTLSLQKYMAKKSKEPNVVFAPVNIGGALALVLLASSGKTFDEISNILGLASGVDIQANSERVHMQIGRILDKLDRSTTIKTDEEVKLASAIFVQDDYPIRSVFKQASEQIYRSEILNVDFTKGVKARDAINAWVNDRTNSKIKEIFNNDPPAYTKAIIVSALYFKASWEKPFSQGATRRKQFYVNGRDQESNVMVDFMANGGLFPYYRDRVLDCEIMGFPYKENKSTLYVIMPKHSNKQKLEELQNRLTPEDLEKLADSTRYTQSMILFPKMTLESEMDLSDALIEFGASSLFNAREANLALLSPGHNAFGASSNLSSENPPTGRQHPNQGSAFQSTQNFQNDQFVPSAALNPIEAETSNSNANNQVLIFSRTGVPINCTEIFDPTSNITKCQEIDEATQKEVIYKKFGDKVGRRISRNTPYETIDTVRQHLTANDNPGLYANQVLHKVFMEITESGTEAAAVTSVSLTRTGDFQSFKIDQPFIFFIRNHETRLILFWGSVTKPTPNYSN